MIQGRAGKDSMRYEDKELLYLLVNAGVMSRP